jgi:predicted ATPase
LAAQLGDRRLLLILDNVDPVAEAATLLAGLLAATPGLHVLTTGREALRIAAEVRYAVAPLDEAASMALFAARARASDPAFDPTSHLATLARICARLDGLPLALELAAARLRVLTSEAVLAGLTSRLRLLAHGTRDLPPHQRTLRAAIDWSHDLLTPDERLVFRRVGIFAGGWTIEAATAVCDDAPGLPSPTIAVPVILEALADKSLLRAEGQGGDARFAMLDSLREYAVERLAASDEDAGVAQRHATQYLALAYRTQEPPGQAGAPIFDLLEREGDNLRTALRWYLAHRDAALGLALTLLLFPYWYARGRFAEGRHWTGAMLALSGGDQLYGVFHDRPGWSGGHQW